MKKIIFLCVVVLFYLLTATTALASKFLPYDTYNYDYWDSIVFTPAPYVPLKSISGIALGVGAFSNPQGFVIGPDGLVYIADTGNHRIVVLNRDLSAAVSIIDTIHINGQADSFNTPTGIAVSDDNLLYIADTENMRIVVLDQGKVINVIRDPQSEMLDPGFIFKPLKLGVDYAGRVYAVARGMFQGIMVFSAEGNFTGFFGTIQVKITAWEILWRTLSTKAERTKQHLFIPTEFTGVAVDPDGFIYASSIDPDGKQAVRRLNPKGEDVIRKGPKENLGGDIWSTASGSPYAGPSYIVDITYRGKGIYSMLDSRRGRIFTYDHEGYLLYVFGGLGTQTGTFKQPCAIGVISTPDDKIIVLDAGRNELIVFQATRYGLLINEAVSLRYDGDEALAVQKWQAVLQLNENLEIANVGIGKAYLTSGDDESAMKYLSMGKDRTYYSIAFKRYRNQILKNSIPYVLTVGSVLLLTGLTFKLVFRRRQNKRGKSVYIGE